MVWSWLTRGVAPVTSPAWWSAGGLATLFVAWALVEMGALDWMSPEPATETTADEQAAGITVGATFHDCPVCPEMVVVPAGEFMMGSRDNAKEMLVHKVAIRRPFAVGKFEVTFAEWQACADDGGCAGNPSPNDSGWGKGRRPVINVSWNDAKEYVAWLSHKTGKSYRLLTEAEWEFAARAGTTTKYAVGDTLTSQQAQFSQGPSGSAGWTVEVGSFPANPFGLHDMHGNVSEWVEDTWHPNYVGAPRDGSAWEGGYTFLRMLRGGSWLLNQVSARSTARDAWSSHLRSDSIGFRVAREL